MRVYEQRLRPDGTVSDRASRDRHGCFDDASLSASFMPDRGPILTMRIATDDGHIVLVFDEKEAQCLMLSAGFRLTDARALRDQYEMELNGFAGTPHPPSDGAEA